MLPTKLIKLLPKNKNQKIISNNIFNRYSRPARSTLYCFADCCNHEKNKINCTEKLIQADGSASQKPLNWEENTAKTARENTQSRKAQKSRVDEILKRTGKVAREKRDFYLAVKTTEKLSRCSTSKATQHSSSKIYKRGRKIMRWKISEVWEVSCLGAAIPPPKEKLIHSKSKLPLFSFLCWHGKMLFLVILSWWCLDRAILRLSRWHVWKLTRKKAHHRKALPVAEVLKCEQISTLGRKTLLCVSQTECLIWHSHRNREFFPRTLSLPLVCFCLCLSCCLDFSLLFASKLIYSVDGWRYLQSESVRFSVSLIHTHTVQR